VPQGPIYWHHGLFLQPQHFQLTDQTLAEFLAELLSVVRPWFWGAARAEVDAGALAAGRLEFSDLALLFPDAKGVLLATCPGNAICPARRVPAEQIGPGEGMKVYVALRALKNDEPNVTEAVTPEAMAEAATRWVVPAEPEALRDIYGDGPAAQVRRLKALLRIVFEPEAPSMGEHSLVPVARLLREGDTLRLDAGFAPASLTMGAAPALAAILDELRDRVIGKARQLEGYKNISARTGDLGELSVLLMALRSLSRYAARLDQAARTDSLSPWEAYGVLRELVAELSVFSLEVSALGESWQGERLLPDYDHGDLGACFRTAREVCVRLLESISAGPRWAARFTFKDPYWTLEVPQPVLAEGGEFWLVLSSEQGDPERMCASARKLLKLSATGGMASLLVRAVPGIPLGFSETPPAGLPRRPGALYFRVGTESNQWNDVVMGRSLSIYWDDAPADLDAQLAVIGR
jgi:type VI secretion system protein ImpJ